MTPTAAPRQGTIREREHQLYRDMWGMEAYGRDSPGERYAPAFAETTGRPSARGFLTVLDAGCGSGRGGVALAALGYDVTLTDQTPDGLCEAARDLPFFQVCLWDDLASRRNFDHVYCCDVLEHLPTAFTMLVAARLLALARRSLFLSVSLVPDTFGVWVGAPLHQTVQPFTWWRDALRELGDVTDARDLGAAALYIVEPCD